MASINSSFVLFPKTAKCEENAKANVPLDEETMNEDEEEMLEEKSAYLPPFSYLLNPIKNLTLNSPGCEISGFKFSLGSGLSNNFVMSHEFHLAPKSANSQTGNPMMDLFSEKTPFYSLNIQYHHGALTQTSQNVAFSLVGRTDSTGKVDAIFFKTWANLRMKIHSSFMNSNLMYSSTQFEVEHQGLTSKQVLTLATQALNYNILERLGKNLVVGLEMNYIFPKKALGFGYGFRYSLFPSQKLFAQYSSMMGGYSFGSLFKFTDEISAGLELEVGGQKGSTASFGLQRKTKQYKVNTSLRSDGDMKSIFSYNTMAYKLKLFLGGNLWKEDFRSGYSFSFGQTDE